MKTQAEIEDAVLYFKAGAFAINQTEGWQEARDYSVIMAALQWVLGMDEHSGVPNPTKVRLDFLKALEQDGKEIENAPNN